MPKHGQIITFTRVPTGSWCSTDTAYRVDRPGDKGSFRFVNIERGSSTIDAAWAVARAEFTVVEG